MRRGLGDVYKRQILNQPFDFNVDEEINLDYENLSYASNLDELRNLWRKRLKLSTLDAFASKKEINEDKIDQEEANKFGEELGNRIAENPSDFFSEVLINTGLIWYVLLIVLIIPVIWFWLANLYKRVSAIFISNRKKK